MEPEGSLPHSQQPATCPYPEPYKAQVRDSLELNLTLWHNLLTFFIISDVTGV
jgi:hypothetical protein